MVSPKSHNFPFWEKWVNREFGENSFEIVNEANMNKNEKQNTTGFSPEVELSIQIIKSMVARGYKYNAIATIIDVKPSFISMVANGQRTLSITHLVQLADKLDLTLPEFLENSLGRPPKGNKKQIELYKCLTGLYRDMTKIFKLLDAEKVRCKS